MVSDSILLLIGCILGFLMLMSREVSFQQKRQTQKESSTRKEYVSVTPEYTSHFIFGPWGLANITGLRSRITNPVSFPRHNPGGIPVRARPLIGTNKKGNAIVETWRKSIVGLVTLAEKNLESAKENLKIKNYERAVQTASTSVENIARALIHCYGGKPDPDSGQEEVLRILSRRFREDEKIEFEKALDNVARANHNRTVPPYLSTHKIQTQLFDKARTKQILEASSRIVSLFKRIITEHFGEEIPQLHACAYIQNRMQQQNGLSHY